VRPTSAGRTRWNFASARTASRHLSRTVSDRKGLCEPHTSRSVPVVSRQEAMGPRRSFRPRTPWCRKKCQPRCYHHTNSTLSALVRRSFQARWWSWIRDPPCARSGTKAGPEVSFASRIFCPSCPWAGRLGWIGHIQTRTFGEQALLVMSTCGSWPVWHQLALECPVHCRLCNARAPLCRWVGVFARPSSRTMGHGAEQGLYLRILYLMPPRTKARTHCRGWRGGQVQEGSEVEGLGYLLSTQR